MVCDGFGTHEGLEILDFCFANKIVLCRLPSHTSHNLQSCDIAVFAPLKAAYRNKVELIERAGVNTIGKQHFTTLYSSAREVAFSKRNIFARWSKAGLFPFNPSRVLRDMPEPPSQSSTDEKETIVSCTPRRASLRTPTTPVTSASIEGLMSLQKVIVRDDAFLLDQPKKEILERHVEKLSKAAHSSFAKIAIQTEQTRFLLAANIKAKVRRSTRSIVLGKAKVMSFEDLKEARTERHDEEAA